MPPACSISPHSSSPQAKIAILLTITDIKGHQLPASDTPLWRKRPGKFYVRLVVDGEMRKTIVSPRTGAPVWRETFYFDAHTDSILKLDVFARHITHQDYHAGGVEENIESLLSSCTNDSVLTLRRPISGNSDGIVEFTIKSSKSLNLAEEHQLGAAVMDANAEIHLVPAPAELHQVDELIEVVNNVIDGSDDAADSWEPLLSKVELFSQMIDKLAQIHPYAQIAWGAISAAHKIILAQKARDKNVDDLVSAMNDAFAFVHEADPLKKIDFHRELLMRMIRQTTECAYFIYHYAKEKNFWKKSFVHLLSEADDKIAEFKTSFNEMRVAFQTQAAVETEINVIQVRFVTLNIQNTIDALVTKVDLHDMAYANGAGRNPGKECLPQTRQGIIDDLVKWITDPDPEDTTRLLWLSGLAGSGKTAIAHTIARLFDDQNRLGSFFAFDISRQTELQLHHLFSTIAVDLADLDTNWKSSLWDSIKAKRSLRTTTSIQSQFDGFLVKPSANLSIMGPIVIVIDALDESGDEASREEVLSVLADRTSDLPPNFRFILTSRPEEDIQTALRHNPRVFHKSMDAIDRTSTNADLTVFVQSELSTITSLDRELCLKLVLQSEGLFQWAFTACRFIKGPVKRGWTPTERLSIILSSSSNLDSLYSSILERIFDIEDAIPMTRFKDILGTLLEAKEPLSVRTLCDFCDGRYTREVVESIIRPLGSLLSGVSEEEYPVRPLHSSFRDFLVDEARSKGFYADGSLQNRSIALASLRVLRELRFNICQLETSHLRNEDIPDLPSRINHHISSSLSYSCRFWMDHVRVTEFEAGLLDQVREFLYEGFLYWIEVLSLLRALSIASKAALALGEWASSDMSVVALANDIAKFISVFRNPISQSTPHIYLSALPFSPRESTIRKTFLPKFSKMLKLQIGAADNWPPILSVLEHHIDSVDCVAFSPSGKQIASGSQDNTIIIWDAEDGHVIAEVLHGSARGVKSLVFSPDGTRLVSGSNDGTIRVWHAYTGKPVLAPLLGHLGSITSLAISINGKLIASGSSDRMVRIWNAETGDAVGAPLQGHRSWVMSVAFSSDTNNLLSGSSDSTIRLWDIKTNDKVPRIFSGHEKSVLAVAFSENDQQILSISIDYSIRIWDLVSGESIVLPLKHISRKDVSELESATFSPDKKLLVVGLVDHTVRVWSAESGDLVSGPLYGHTDWVSCVAFSPNGTCVASGSQDKTVRVWDVKQLMLTSQSFQGHVRAILSVDSSPDGNRIVSGSRDRTVRVWDTRTDEVTISRHRDFVTCVAFSPDGKYIVSGSYDKTIQIWDARTGDPIAEPFKGHKQAIRSVVFSSDGRLIISGSSDETIRIWRVDSQTEAAVYRGHTSAITSLGISSDNKQLISGSEDMTVRLWDLQLDVKSPEIRIFHGHTDVVLSVAFSSDCQHIASASHDATIRVWTMTSGVSVVFDGHTGPVRSVAIFPNGKYMVSGSDDQTILVWNIQTCSPVLSPLRGHTDAVLSVACSRSGTSLVSVSEDKTIRVWDVSDLSDNKPVVATQLGEFEDGSPIVNGWILDSNSDLLFWVPPWNRVGLWWPRNTFVLADQSVKLDFGQFVHGAVWTQCRDEM